MILDLQLNTLTIFLMLEPIMENWKLESVGRFFNSKVSEGIKSSKIFKNSKVKNLMSFF